ncbi:MAG TPA: nucleotide exchange factor GrpE [Acidimicrobiales bacterium]|jgi:molecular chaperone GrpE|nr:nucleotide exchange factor GrpE [Acidimicrobiales bacterium]
MSSGEANPEGLDARAADLAPQGEAAPGSEAPENGDRQAGQPENGVREAPVEAVAPEAGAVDGAPPPSPEPADLAQLAAERDEYLDTLRRLQAEFDNYRKRTIRQQTALLERAAEQLLERLLPALDALGLAIAHAREDESGRVAIESLEQVESLFWDILAKEGLERIDAASVAFDPHVHDAVAHEGGADGEGGPGAVVVEVLRPGYALKGRVLRPAMVKVRG